MIQGCSRVGTTPSGYQARKSTIPGHHRSQGTTSITDTENSAECPPGRPCNLDFFGRYVGCDNWRLERWRLSGYLLVVSQARTATASTGSGGSLHCRLELVAGSADLPSAHQVAALHSTQQNLRRPGRLGVDLLCQRPYIYKLVGNGPSPQDGAVQGCAQLNQGRSEFVTRLLWTRRRLTPGLTLEELRDSRPIARPEQGILRFGGVLLSYNPSAGSRQTRSVMVVMRLKTEWLGPIFLPEVPHVATMSRQHGHGPGYKVMLAATIKPM